MFTGNRNTQYNAPGYPLFGLWGKTITYNDKNGDGIPRRQRGLSGRRRLPRGRHGDLHRSARRRRSSSRSTRASRCSIASSSISAQLDHKQGNLKFNNTLRHQCQGGLSCEGFWDPEATLYSQARTIAVNNYATYTGMYENGRFTRLREVAVTYQLPDATRHQDRASRASLVVAGRNLHVWTPYTGVDPETTVGNGDRAATRSISRRRRSVTSRSASTSASEANHPMANTHGIRRMMSLSSKARSRICRRSPLSPSPRAAAGCKKDSLLQVTDPDILNTGDYSTPAGATPLRVGVIANFTSAFDGGTDSFVTITGNLADELLASDTFDGRLTINARKSVETNSEMESVYRAMQRARTAAARAAGILATTRSDAVVQPRRAVHAPRLLRDDARRGLVLRAFRSRAKTARRRRSASRSRPTRCSRLAVAHFDTALSLAETNARVLNGSKIGKGRALINLGKFAEAAAAVAGVPTNFVLTTSHSSNSSSNGAWSASTSGASRYRLMTSEGKNGLPFLGQTAAQDARIDLGGVDARWIQQPVHGAAEPDQVWPVHRRRHRDRRGSTLIELESQLQAGTQAARDAVFAGLNTLRTGGAAIGGRQGHRVSPSPRCRAARRPRRTRRSTCSTRSAHTGCGSQATGSGTSADSFASTSATRRRFSRRVR